MGMFIKLILTGQKRRRREMWYVSLAAFIAVSFMSSVTLFQNIMDRYLMETNYRNYGDWAISAVKDYEDSSILFSEIDHPYFSSRGICVSGPPLIGQNLEPSGMCIGTADEPAKQLGNITLYEGRFPETETEIAMDLSSLSALGYDYEPGQTIRIAVLSDGEVSEADYLLTGTIKSFAANWKHKFRYPLPNGIVTKEGLARVAAPCYATYFYRLDRSYEDIDMQEFTQAFLTDGHAREYNSYVYENRVWGSKEMFDSIRLLLTCIGALAMGYLMLSYVSQRRKWYYRLRSAGADKTQIRWMIFIEAAYGAVPYALLGMTVPYAIGAAVCAGVSAGRLVPYLFTFRAADFFGQAGTAIGMILFSVLCAWTFAGDKNLSRNSSGITKRQRARLRRDAKKERNTGRIFLRRQRMLHPLQHTSFTLFSFGICLFLILCFQKMYEAGRTYAETTETLRDFSAQKKNKFGMITPASNGHGSGGGAALYYDMYFGIPQPTEDEIRSLIGIQKAGFITKDQSHILTWQGKHDSPIEQYIKNEYEQNNRINHPDTQFFYFESDKEILNELRRDFPLQTLDEEAFLNGEELILLLVPFWEWDQSMQEKAAIQETTIRPGDTVEIVSAEAQLSVPLEFENHDSLPGRVPVKVGTVIEEPPLSWRIRLESYHSNYQIIASEALARRVAQADQKQLCHNSLQIDLGGASSFEATQKRLADIFNEQEMEYQSNAEELAMARNVYIRNLCIYGVLSGVVLFLFLLLQIHFHRLQDQYRKREYGLLKQLGMERGFWIKTAVRESFSENGWMVFCVPCGYALTAAQVYRELLQQKETVGLNQWSDKLQAYVSDPAALTADQMRACANPAFSLATVLLLILVLAGIRFVQVHRAVKEEG